MMKFDLRTVLFVGLPLLCVGFGGCGKEPTGIEPPWNIDVNHKSAVVYVGHLFKDTVHVVSEGSVKPAYELSSPHDGILLNDSILSWTPTAEDTGTFVVEVIISTSLHRDTTSWDIRVVQFWPTGCADYTHKDDVNIGTPAQLPEGYFVFDQNNTPGLYKSKVAPFHLVQIPNTHNDFPRAISISDDGKWIAYVNNRTAIPYIIKANGAFKTRIPVTVTDSGFPTVVGFWRNGPFSCEVFYPANYTQLRSVRVEWTKGNPQFKNDRLIVDLQGQLQFNAHYTIQMSLVKDQLFCEMCPVINGRVLGRSGFLTIPDLGRGIGTPNNIYKWLNDTVRALDGCGHTQSFDGTLTLSNPGWNLGSTCIPSGHVGFCITPFRRDTDSPILLETENFNKYGTSINWAPEQYRQVGYTNFWGWYFSNLNDYIVGRQMLTQPYAGLTDEAWVVAWRTNTWIPLTPEEQNIHISQPAIYFGKNDTGIDYLDTTAKNETADDTLAPVADFFNPIYRVVKPNGGERYLIGQPCTVQVASVRPGKGMLMYSIDGGIIFQAIPGFGASVNPQNDSVFVFTIPAMVDIFAEKVSTISGQCVIKIEDYSEPGKYYDASDGDFEISH